MRIQLEFDASGVSALEWAKSSTGIKTYRELFNSALSAFLWIIRETQKGRVIVSINDDESSFRELVMPTLRLPRNQTVEVPDRAAAVVGSHS